jgi:hypothetical protein
MGHTNSVPVQFLTTETGPNDFRSFDEELNPEVPGRKWQWKFSHSLCGEPSSTGAAAKAHADKLKKPKDHTAVRDCRALVFQLATPAQVAAANHELELPYKPGIPLLIFVANTSSAPTDEVIAAVKARLSTRAPKQVRVIPYDGAGISAAARSDGADWLQAQLQLPRASDGAGGWGGAGGADADGDGHYDGDYDGDGGGGGDDDGNDYPEETLSLVVVGSAHVGKTSLLQRYVNDEFNLKQVPTMGIDKFTVKRRFRLPGRSRPQPFILDIWDTAGEARYRTVTLAFYNSAHG